MATSTTQLTQPTEEVLNNHTRSAQAMSAEDFCEVLNYVINRLLKDYSPIRSNENLNSLNINASATTAASGNISKEKLSANNEDMNTPSPSSGVVRESCVNERSSNAYASTTPTPAINLKVFYQVTASPAAMLLLEGLRKQRLTAATSATPANVVYTVMPAIGLHHYGTFLSICGVRHD